jgi:hypothetical protein
MLFRPVALAAAFASIVLAVSPATAGVPKTLILEHFADYFA